MAKKKRKTVPYRQQSEITYNKYKPNRKARRAGIKPEKPPEEKKEKKTISKLTILSESVCRARKLTKKITPLGMTYKEYIEFLKERQQELRKNAHWQCSVKK